MSALPKSVTLIRHGESAYNILRKQKEADPLYQKFMQSYERSVTSRRTRDLAEKVQKKFAARWGDHNTPLTHEGIRQAYVTGQKLGFTMPHPDIIFCSPYIRTRNTLTHIIQGWPRNTTLVTPANLIAKTAPEYRDIKDTRGIDCIEVIFELLLREQSYGTGILYNDWRVFQALNPEQKTLRDLNTPYWYKYPQGESMADTQLRTELFWMKYEKICEGKNVLIVSHHRTILCDLASKEGLTDEEVLALDKNSPPVNCGITTYHNIGSKLELISYNKCLWED